ncbi:XRE family transcriptional regulator [Castellaniella sp. GW247-6E4]|uniref:helix-turn-helix domain-containing protein n=1 Tax=Castellaniella sp. GW247-6E4 TaxID=3140380 RepID=UPI003315CAEC
MALAEKKLGLDTSPLDSLGFYIRSTRVEMGMTLNDLSKRAGVSVAMLSHIERSQVSPSLKTLDRIRVALGVPLSRFFRSEDAPRDTGKTIVMKADERPKLSFDGIGLVKELLSPNQGGSLEVFMLVIQPGGSSGNEPWTRTGEKAGLVLSGHFDLVVGPESWSLDMGDSFQFDSSVPHRFQNNGTTEARVLWVIKSDAPV